MKNTALFLTKKFFTCLALAALMVPSVVTVSAQNLTQTNAFLPDPTFYPQYIGSGTSTRFPCMFRATITNLAASTTYRYYVQVATNADLGAAQSGAGNSMLVNPAGTTFTYTTGPGLTTAGNFETFTTDATGNYTGWFGFVHSGNARFTAGAQLFPAITIGNTAGTVLLRYAPPASSGTFLCLAFSTSAGANNGTGIRETNSSATAKNFVVLHDNTAGSGRPLTVTFVESDANNLASGAAYYGAVGTGPVDGIAGAWGTMVPNTLANGVRRIAQYNNAGALIGGNTDSDGAWPSGATANTVNPAGGTTTILDIKTSDAPLNIANTITYNGNSNTGGTAPTDGGSPYAVGSTVTVLGTGSLVRAGYTFTNWNTAANGSGSSFATNVTFNISSNTTLYAQWLVLPPVITGAATATAFTTTYGTASAAQNFSVSGANLTANLVATAPTGFEVSSDGTTYGGTATFTQSGGTASGTLRIRLAATATVSGSYNSKNIVLSSSGATSVNVATAASGNVVNAKTLTVTANNTNRVYGVANPTFTAVYTGYTNGDTSAVLSGNPSLTTTATVNSNAGNYTITAAVGSLSAANYSFSFVNGTLTVAKATPSFSFFSSANPSGYKDSLTFTANSFAVDVTGTVQFMTNGANLGSAVAISGFSAASIGVAGLPRGTTNVVRAIYSGDANYFSITNTLTQTVTNHPPVANENSYSRNGLSSWKISISDLLTNATDVDVESLALDSVTTSTNGIVFVISGGFVLYTNTNLVDDRFSYTVTDGFGGTNTGVITLTVGSGATGASSITTITGTNPKVLTAYGIPGFTYVTQRATNVNQSVWDDIATNTLPNNSVIISVTDNNPPPDAAFYRLKWQP